jgi:hypothetical protein
MAKKLTVGKKHIVLRDPIFGCKIHVFVNYSYAAFGKWLAKVGAYEQGGSRDNYEDNFAGFSTVMSTKGKPDQFIICVKEFDWTLSDQNTLIHEIVHTIIKIWSSNNIPYNLDTQEFLAHSIGNLYEDIASKLVR